MNTPHQIASAIIFNGIHNFLLSEGEDLSDYSIKKAVPYWFSNLHPKKDFPISKPKVPNPEKNGRVVDEWLKDPHYYDLPEDLQDFQNEYLKWLREERIWNIGQNLILLRKWVFWCADFCDIQRDFSLTLQIGAE